MGEKEQGFLDKYKDIIKEEVNVKEVDFLPEEKEITKIIKPLGSAISQKFGKETGTVIKYAKEGNVEETKEGVRVFGDEKERFLEEGEYEIEYSGVDENNMAVDGDVITKLDLEIDSELEKEGVVREISRFLNQMRKDAGYNVEDRISLFFKTSSDYLFSVINSFSDSLSNEALLKSVEEGEPKQEDIRDVFTNEAGEVTLMLKK